MTKSEICGCKEQHKGEGSEGVTREEKEVLLRGPEKRNLHIRVRLQQQLGAETETYGDRQLVHKSRASTWVWGASSV